MVLHVERACDNRELADGIGHGKAAYSVSGVHSIASQNGFSGIPQGFEHTDGNLSSWGGDRRIAQERSAYDFRGFSIAHADGDDRIGGEVRTHDKFAEGTKSFRGVFDAHELSTERHDGGQMARVDLRGIGNFRQYGDEGGILIGHEVSRSVWQRMEGVGALSDFSCAWDMETKGEVTDADGIRG